MDFALDDEQRAWRDEVRAFLREHVTPAFTDEVERIGFEMPGPQQQAFWAEVAAKGWLGLTFPEEYGGMDKGPIFQHILINEFEYAHCHRPGLAVTSIAPMILRYGTEENKREWLPPIISGELSIALGYSEPNAGTDLASLRTRAELHGDEWVINGQKTWNSYAHMATHEWLTVRTDPEQRRHRGISVIIVPIDTPGIEIRPIVTWSGMRTNEAFFTDVRVPRGNLIGEAGQGWRYITGALDLERGVVTNAGDLRRQVDEILRVAGGLLPDGRRPSDDPDVRRKIAQLDADVEVAQLMGLEAATYLETGHIPTATVTAAKIFTSELRQRIADVATGMLGLYGVLGADDPHAVHHGAFELAYRLAPLMRFGGGTNEVLRDVIAQRGHGLPAYGR